MAELRRFAREADFGEMLAAFGEDGAVIVESMVQGDTIAAMRDAVVAHADAVEPGSRGDGFWPTFHGAATKRFTHLGRLSPAFFDILANPVMEAFGDAVLLPRCGSYWLNTAQVMLIGPGEPAQVLHRDCGNWNNYVIPQWPDVPEVTVSAMIALDQTTEELGATRVIPGSHLWDDYREGGDPGASIAAELMPGSALVYSGKVLHGGGANRTGDRWRNAMHLSFVLGWLTPEDANSMQYTADEIAHLPERSKRLLGHSSYDPGPHHGGRLWLKDFEAWSA